MAGNIIPAIATTNAIIAGLIVLEGLKILSGKIEQCRAVSVVQLSTFLSFLAFLNTWFVFSSPLKIFLNKQPNPKKKLLVPCALDPPNPNCYVCASKPEVTVKLNVHKVTVLTLQDKVSQLRFFHSIPTWTALIECSSPESVPQDWFLTFLFLI